VLNLERHYASEAALQQPQASEERFMLPKTALHFFTTAATPPDPTVRVRTDHWCRRQSGGRRFEFDRFRRRLLRMRRDRHLTFSEKRSAGISDPPSTGRALDHALAENVEAWSSGCDALGSIGPIRTTGNQDCYVVA
jgi:hypothetical protein